MNLFKTSRNQLLMWGGLMVGIYGLFVFMFPLVPHIYRDGKMLDIEMMLQTRRWLIWVYIVGLALLFLSFWRILRLLHNFSQQNPAAAGTLRPWILGIGGFSGLILLWLYPITAIDVAIYSVNARNWVLYGKNPLTVAPQAAADDPYIRFTGEFIGETSPYGPLWEAIARIPVQSGITDIAGTIIAIKAISLLAYLCVAILIGWSANQQGQQYGVHRTTALAFFALNPLVLLEALGNGHNDMTMLAFLTLGLVLWQKDRWAWSTIAFSLAALVKIPALIILPLFALSTLIQTDTWWKRIWTGLMISILFLSVFLIGYRLMGPFPDVFEGALRSFTRRGFSPTYALYVIVREFLPNLSRYILPHSRDVFIGVYLLIAVGILRKKMSLLEAGFSAYLAMLFLSNAFRIWYPLWLIPFASLNLNSRTYWRTFLFSLTAEFSILSYYVLWRWGLRHWEWGEVTGPLAEYWDYYKIMTPFTVAWTFSIPFAGDLIGRIRNWKKFTDRLWI